MRRASVMVLGILIFFASGLRRSAGAETISVGLLVKSDGKVELWREGWSRPVSTDVGQIFFPGDRIKPEKGVSSSVLCGDFVTLWEIPSGIWSSPASGCPAAPSPVLWRKGQRVISSRILAEPEILLGPRGRVCDPKLVLRRHESTDTKRYLVHIVDTQRSKIVWGPVEVQDETSNLASVRGIEPNVSYRVHVRVLQEGPLRNNTVSFMLLDEGTCQRIADEVLRFREVFRDEEFQAFGASMLMASHGLLEAARHGLSANPVETAPLMLVAGDLSKELGFVDEAKGLYNNALAEAKDRSEAGSEAEAILALAQISRKIEEAGELYREAALRFEKLGAIATAESVRKEAEALGARGQR